jgi:hypothetical protein
MDEAMPTLEKMYMVHTLDDNTPCLEDDEHVSHMELPTSTTPTSKECDHKGNNIGIGDAMIPLGDMNMLSYECFTLSPIACNMLNNCSFPCIACNDDNDTFVVTTLPNNGSFPRFVDNKDRILNMFCAQCLQYYSINATKMLNTFSFKCLVCNNVNMFDNEKAPIAISNNEDFAFAHDQHVFTYTLHNHHEYYDILLDANGDVQIKRCIMMDDVFIYHAHTLFLLYFVCVDTRTKLSTLIEHELAKRALESIILVSSISNFTRLPFPCFASNLLKNFSSIWFLYKHVDDSCATCDIHAPMILNIDALCVATYMLDDFSFFCFVCNHIAMLAMTCHMYYRFEFIGVTFNKLTNCSFFWLGCITSCDNDILF